MIDELFNRQYDHRRYHCVHFVIDAANTIFELDYAPSFIGLTGSLDETIKTSRETAHRNKQIKNPTNGCIVLMTKQDNSSHVGIYYKNKVLHLTDSGVQLLTLNQIELIFKRVRFYEPNLRNQ